MKALVAVELQLPSDFLFLYSKANGIQHQVDCLRSCSFVGHDTVVVQIPDHGKVQDSLLGVDVGDICDPFTVGSFCVEFSVEQIFILVYLLSQLFPLSAPADFGQQTVAFHKSEDGFGILVAAVLVQPELHSAIAVCIFAAFLLTCNLIHDFLIWIWPVHSLNVRIIPTSGNAKESAHSVNGMCLPVTVNYSIFYPGAHSLSADCRKSRSNSFSIFKRSISAL